MVNRARAIKVELGAESDDLEPTSPYVDEFGVINPAKARNDYRKIVIAYFAHCLGMFLPCLTFIFCSPPLKRN